MVIIKQQQTIKELFIVECEVGEVRLVGPNNTVGTAGEVEYCYNNATNGTQWLGICAGSISCPGSCEDLSRLICQLVLGNDGANNGT